MSEVFAGNHAPNYVLLDNFRIFNLVVYPCARRDYGKLLPYNPGKNVDSHYYQKW